MLRKFFGIIFELDVTIKMAARRQLQSSRFFSRLSNKKRNKDFEKIYQEGKPSS
jgi:hypothetical protein